MPLIRKNDGRVIIRTSITLRPGRDDTLIDLMQTTEQSLAATVREAMRNGVVEDAEFIADDDQAIDFSFGIEL